MRGGRTVGYPPGRDAVLCSVCLRGGLVLDGQGGALRWGQQDRVPLDIEGAVSVQGGS